MLSFKIFLEFYVHSYNAIGHDGPDNYAWIWIKRTGKLISEKSAGHSMFDKINYDWSGRYEPKTNRVSVVPKQKTVYSDVGPAPNLRIPPELKRVLQDEYGDNIIFKPFDGAR